MEGGGITEVAEKNHGMISLAVLAISVVLLILVILLFAKTAMVAKEKLNNKGVSEALRKLGSSTMFGSERMTSEQQRNNIIAGLQGQEHLTASDNLIRRELGTNFVERMDPGLIKRGMSSSFEKMDQPLGNLRRKLQGGLGSEKFINQFPMLGGARLTDGATALRAADPIASEPISPSQQQYIKENELLEHLLNK